MSSFFPSSRKGMEIAIGTLVVMILGILIVGGGIVMIAKISGGGIEAVSKVSKDREHELQALMTEGQLVALLPSDQKATAGKSITFGLGINNQFGADDTFTVDLIPQGTTLGTDPSEWRASYMKNVPVKNNEQQVVPIVVTPGNNVPSGTYTFIVKVTHQPGGESSPIEYDSPRFFSVRVQ